MMPMLVAAYCLRYRITPPACCRGNNFSGPLDLRRCSQLQLADLQGNRFSGSLPVDGRNRALSVLRADHNSFNGSIPLGLWDLPALMALELTNNRCGGARSAGIPRRAPNVVAPGQCKDCTVLGA